MQAPTISIAFSGDIPLNYELYLGPMFFEPFALDMAHRISTFKPSRVLELAAGTGRLTKFLPYVTAADSEIQATDINPAMVKFSQEKFAGLPVNWKEVDAVSLPYADDSFDCVAVQFGVMFYSDKQKAFREAFRVLKPGGRLIFNCWDSIENNPMAGHANDTLHHFFPVDTPAFYTVPFSYFNEAQITDDVKQAGFKQVNIELLKLIGYSGSAENAAKGLMQGTPTITAIEERGKELLPDIMELLERRIERSFGQTAIRVPLQARVVTCIK